MTTINWDKVYLSGTTYTQVSPSMLRSIVELVKAPTGACLDIGCGRGELLQGLADLGYVIYGVDSSSTALRDARTALPNTNFYQQDLESGLPDFHEKTFQLITMKSVYPFLNKKDLLLSDIEKSLASNGVFLLINSSVAQAPEHKKHIGIDLEETLSTLRRHFSDVRQVSADATFTYIAAQH